MENKDTASENKVYELGYHIVPTVEESKVSEIVVDIKKFLEKNNCEQISSAAPEMRNLSYEIVKSLDSKNLKYSKAYFGWMKFAALPATIEELKSKLGSNNDILRYIIIKTVRENTMYSKPPMRRSEKESGDVPEQSVEVEVSEEDMDKSIDALIEE